MLTEHFTTPNRLTSHYKNLTSKTSRPRAILTLETKTHPGRIPLSKNLGQSRILPLFSYKNPRKTETPSHSTPEGDSANTTKQKKKTKETETEKKKDFRIFSCRFVKKENDSGKKNSRSEPKRLRSIVWYILFAESSPGAAVIGGDHGGRTSSVIAEVERDGTFSL